MWFNFAKQLRWIALLSMSVASMPALAAVDLSALLSGSKQTQNQLLDADVAFALSFNEADAQVNYKVAPEYYIYIDRLSFMHGQRTIAAQIPKGTVKDDPSFGRVEVAYGQFTVDLDLRGLKAGDTLTLGYQGCADLGVCYPPMTQQFTLLNDASSSPLLGEPKLANQGQNSTPVNEQQRFVALLSQANFAVIVFGFFVAGLLLSFTPCVLPMVPILASIIRGDQNQSEQRPAFLLSVVYVLAMAFTYAIAGVVVALSGINIQAHLQSPWVIGAISSLFILLAGGMFGFYHLGLPAALTAKLNALSQRQKGGSYIGVAVMGLLSALIVGPCVTPPLIGALAYISQSNDAVLGGFALLSMGFGMGVPLLLVGTSAGRWLPKTGAWMAQVNIGFGFMLLALALWMLSRLFAEPTMWMLGRALGASALFYVVFSLLLPALSNSRRLVAGAALAAALAILLSGASSLKAEPAAIESRSVAFQRFDNVGALQAAIATATKPVVLDLYADWCVSCKELERDAFIRPEAIAMVDAGEIAAMQLDLTKFSDEFSQYLSDLNIYGPPALLFFDANGQEREALRAAGVIDGDAFVERLRFLLKP